MTASAAFLRDVKLRRRPCEAGFLFATFSLTRTKKKLILNTKIIFKLNRSKRFCVVHSFEKRGRPDMI